MYTACQSNTMSTKVLAFLRSSEMWILQELSCNLGDDWDVDGSRFVCVERRLIGLSSSIRRGTNHPGRRRPVVWRGYIWSSWWFGSWSCCHCFPLRDAGTWCQIPETSACATASTFVWSQTEPLHLKNSTGQQHKIPERTQGSSRTPNAQKTVCDEA